MTTYMTRHQQRTTDLSRRLELVKLRNARLAAPQHREFYNVVELAMATRGVRFNEAFALVNADREQAARKERDRKNGIPYRSASW